MIALVMIVLALQMTRDTKITRSYIYLRKTKTCLVKHFCSNPYNNTHDFEQRSKTYQQIQSFFSSTSSMCYRYQIFQNNLYRHVNHTFHNNYLFSFLIVCHFHPFYIYMLYMFFILDTC